jgi:hypothetical protein
MQVYWVYFNVPTKRTRIHRAECGSCKGGIGSHEVNGGKNSQWKKFSDRELAFSAAKKMSGHEPKGCGLCKP